ncbi:MAG: CotH kinase family protein [Blautia sp.]|nr:CotH kinase family protein [Blautia sp.]MCM1199863.1 CotH kinase family protein [Bacteroides fragilis]
MTGRKGIYCILIGIGSILLLGLNRLSDYRDESISETKNREMNDGFAADGTKNLYICAAGHKIALWEQNGQYYAFLPSACKNAGMEPEIPDGIEPSSIVWMYSENIPAVFIDTESGTAEQINNDKNYREPGYLSVLEADGKSSFELSLAYIKGRGNTSFTEFAKKPFQIKLSDAVPFLGMESARKWIFVSNAADPTLLRNALSRNLADRLGLAQSKEGVFVDLYLNGEYWGNYYVVEKIEIRNNRLDITDLEQLTEIANDETDLSLYETAWTDTTKAKQIPKEPGDITGGYLIERDFDDRFLKEVETNGSYFITDAQESFILRSPEYASENQIAYIDEYIQNVENAILASDSLDSATGKYYTDLIDLDSFVRKYLLEEVTANYDGGVASSCFYKDIDAISNKLYAGPVWDYDVTWGNTPAYLGHISSSPDRLTRLAAHSDSSPWFSALYDKPEFYHALTVCYQNEISAYLRTLAREYVPQLAEMTAASAAMDRMRWEEQYILNEDTASREEEIAFLSDYILKRGAFLDRAWIEQIPVHQITLLVEDALYDTLYVFDGEKLPALPEADFDFAQFSHWAAPDDTMPDTDAPVQEDMTFHAVLQY